MEIDLTLLLTTALESMGKDVFNYRPYKSSLKRLDQEILRFIAKKAASFFGRSSDSKVNFTCISRKIRVWILMVGAID